MLIQFDTYPYEVRRVTEPPEVGRSDTDGLWRLDMVTGQTPMRFELTLHQLAALQAQINACVKANLQQIPEDHPLRMIDRAAWILDYEKGPQVISVDPVETQFVETGVYKGPERRTRKGGRRRSDRAMAEIVRLVQRYA